ncbi:hypothetical protein KP509_34G043400 [Ceratopteris richardii]|nr:hypothetical protein KP509_34G043400 [Ceratopteris richardii]
MISGYVQHGYGHLAIQLFVQMMEAGIKPDNYTYVGIVKASTSVGALDQGKWVYSLATEHGFESDEYVASALIDMYGKWHRLTDGSNVFKRVTQPNTVTWNALFAGYAQHGEIKEAWDIYLSMRSKGFAPDGVTFICLLSACGHEALIEESLIHLESMHKVHGVEPCFDHFACMLDIFGRAGHINEAMQLLHAMRSPGHDTIWRSLLSHCKTHGSLALGRQCFDKLTAMDAGDSSSYVLMSQLCMDAGEWEEALKLEAQRKSLDARKKPGMAFIEINNQVHHFVTGDLSYPAEGKPRPKIKMLKTAMLQMGYIALIDSVIK